MLLDSASQKTESSSSPERKQERRGREGARASPPRTESARNHADKKAATDSPDSKTVEESAGRNKSSAAESSGFKSLDNLSSVRKHSDVSRKHSDSSSSRVSSSDASRPTAESRPTGVSAHSTNLGRPEGKSFALPDRPADLKTSETRKQRRSSGGGVSSSSSVQTPPRSSDAAALGLATAAIAGRQQRAADGSNTVWAENGEAVIGWKPIQALQGPGDRASPAEKTGGVLTVEEEVRV